MQRRATRRHRRGYSLIEILVVVAIMSLLASVAVPMVMNEYLRGQRKTALLTAQGFRQATSVWRLRTGSEDCPSTDRLVHEHALERGASLQDPWGNLFRIECDEGGVTVRSAGPDRRDGSDDDIIAPPETRSASVVPHP